MASAEYDLIIVGGGPAGLTAGLYAARAMLKAVLVEKGAVGGQVLLTDWIDNYPGFPEGISGFELIDKMAAQASRFGLETKLGSVTAMDLKGTVKRLQLEDGSELTAKSVIIATGAHPKQLGVPGEVELTGKGVSYCATCDGPFYRNQEVAVIGGGNTAVEEAVYLTRFADKVTVIHRRNELRATKIIQQHAFANDKVHFILDTQVERIVGKDGVEGLQLKKNNGEESFLPVYGVFMLIGTAPNNEMLPLDDLNADPYGFIPTDGEMRTSLPGVMAVGDIRSKAVRQVVNAAGEGAVAVLAAEEYLHQLG
ncbi:MAG: thioredoxin-disulfide reductase [Desulfobulbaceae bacterium]|nr:thioredoxin-disulfide reductase [Desulfobulbaceae bacterium]